MVTWGPSSAVGKPSNPGCRSATSPQLGQTFVPHGPWAPTVDRAVLARCRRTCAGPCLVPCPTICRPACTRCCPDAPLGDDPRVVRAREHVLASPPPGILFLATDLAGEVFRVLNPRVRRLPRVISCRPSCSAAIRHGVRRVGGDAGRTELQEGQRRRRGLRGRCPLPAVTDLRDEKPARCRWARPSCGGRRSERAVRQAGALSGRRPSDDRRRHCCWNCSNRRTGPIPIRCSIGSGSAARWCCPSPTWWCSRRSPTATQVLRDPRSRADRLKSTAAQKRRRAAVQARPFGTPGFLPTRRTTPGCDVWSARRSRPRSSRLSSPRSPLVDGLPNTAEQAGEFGR